ncbi:MAG: proprotein convertase P-domain-containing protein, partial [Candidatus Auribacterota bacterium]|nr:proprotein convertase P-domain-containing protein [Candidatus Auribacterota bacterium]
PTTTPTLAPTPYAHCPIYQGTPFVIFQTEVKTQAITLNNPGTVAKVMVNIEEFNVAGDNDLDNIGMYLISPRENVVALFEKHQLAERALAGTWFDDSSSKNIVDGLGPYVGYYHPTGNLADFNGEPIAGDWQLLVFNDYMDPDNPGTGYMNEWAIEICAAVPTSPPPGPTPTPTSTPNTDCWDYTGDGIAWTGITTTTSGIYVGHSGNVNDVEVRVSAECSASLGDISIYLLNPGGTDIALFEVEDLSDYIMYQTLFTDGAATRIDAGKAPYLGTYKPMEDLAGFDGSASAGIWNLMVYNNNASNSGNVSDWELHLCMEGAAPTPTPIPTVTPTPTPPVTPTPPFCNDYNGGTFAWNNIGTFIDTITISDHGAISNATVQITAECSGDLDDIGIYLRSPLGTDVCFFQKHQLSEHTLYKTIFDDTAVKIITDPTNVAPFLGSYRPSGPVTFSNLDGESINGTWTLLVYNDDVKNPGELKEWILTVCKAIPTPSPTCMPTPTPSMPPTPMPIIQSGDYDGDGTSDIGVFRPATGLWSVRSVGTSWFGGVGDLPASGDYDGAGTTGIAIYRGSSGLWAAYGVTRVYFGGSSDISAPGDYDGDGFCDIGIYRESSGLWAIRGVTRLYFGGTGDYPIPADYDGDWFDDFAIFRPSSGLWAVRDVTRVYFGTNTDLPVPCDYDGDGSADIGIVRFPDGLWAIRGISRFYFGTSGDYPVLADYTGDGIDYPGIFRGSSGLWAIKEVTRVYHGASGDIPVAR